MQQQFSISKFQTHIMDFSISFEIALRLMSQDLTDDK